MLDEVERVEGLRRQADHLELARLMAYALNKPSELARVEAELKRAGWSPARHVEVAADVREHAAKVFAIEERIARRRRRRGH